MRPGGTAFDLEPRTKSLDVVATRVITGTSHWTCYCSCTVGWPAPAGWVVDELLRCQLCCPCEYISDDLFSGMCRGNDKKGSGVGS